MKKEALEEVLGKKIEFINDYFNVKMDSKLLNKNDVFIAIKGGNNYIEEAIDKGASLIVCESLNYVNFKNVIIVEDSIKFIQNWAKAYLNKLNILKIAITGSNGKTSTKDIIYSLLSHYKKGSKTIGNYNNHIGLPFTALQVEENHDFVVFEMGMSNFGEIDILADIVKPDISIITNIGDSHLEYLGSREGIFKAKTELIKHTKDKLIINGDDDYLKNIDGIKVGFENNNKYQIELNESFEESCVFSLNDIKNIETNLLGKHNLYNLAMGLTVLKEISYEITEELRKIIKNLNISKMRFEKIEVENIIFINDAYNASPVSMKYALETFDRIYKNKIKIAVLGDMLELGKNSEKFHRDLSFVLKNMQLDYIYLCGEEIKVLYDELKDKKNIFYSQDKCKIKEEIFKIKEPCAVLLKASRGIKLEEIIL